MPNRESSSSNTTRKRPLSYKLLSIQDDDDDDDDDGYIENNHGDDVDAHDHAFHDEHDKQHNNEDETLPLATSDDDKEEGDDDEVDDDDVEHDAMMTMTMMMQPLELQGSEQDSHQVEYQEEEERNNAFLLFLLTRLRNPWLPGTCVSLFLVTPVLLHNCWIFYHALLGRIWTATPFALHLTVTLTATWCLIRQAATTTTYTMNHRSESSTTTTTTKVLSNSFLVVTSISCILDIVLFAKIYPMLWTVLINEFCTDVDGTDIVEWTQIKRSFNRFLFVANMIWISRCLLGMTAIFSRVLWKYYDTVSLSSSNNTNNSKLACGCCCCCWSSFPSGRLLQPAWWLSDMLSMDFPFQGFHRVLDWTIRLSLIFSVLLSSWCLYSLVTHLLPWPTPAPAVPADCDPLDQTECAFPFPSYHHMVPDPTTPTGWRVNLQGHVLPPLKGNIAMDMEFLNRLDGFGTMGPILFYLDGLKEAHEAGAQQLQGPVEHIAQSITPVSITLLLDVTAQQLVPHSAEIDYLDAEHPAVMMFPAQPLKHGTHYAVAVVNAKNSHGSRLAPTPGMQQLMVDTSNDRQQRYVDIVIPALETAADWFSYTTDPQALQLLFDFSTVSEHAQLGIVRTVRDATLTHIQSYSWLWKDHVRAVSVTDFDCRDDHNTAVARTVHAEMDVPWFLNGFGSGHRTAVMDPVAVTTGRARRLGTAKFVLHIPCSVRAAALGLPGGKPLRAIMEYGHGIFANRAEASDDYLVKIANRQGYAIVAMDWRGMSFYDLFVVAQILIAKPRLFEAFRDNLIQGYANKFALLHLARNGLLNTDWFSFFNEQKELKQVLTYNDTRPVTAFYGVSQGGILGAGYVALSGVTGLIDRGVLGAPGTPFTFVMSRSLEFPAYDSIMLLNFYNNRHVRIFLSILQMGAWDSVEASGNLARPVREPYPPIILQAGLGDTIVPTIATEAMARGLNATILPKSPRTIFGIPQFDEANAAIEEGSRVTLTELMYDEEFLALPVDDIFAKTDNNIHVCLRRDPVLIQQLEEFVNTGHVMNPCDQPDACHRNGVNCYW